MEERTFEQQVTDDFTEGFRTRAITVAAGSWLGARLLQTHNALERSMPQHTPDLAHIAEFGYASGTVGAVMLAASYVKRHNVVRYAERKLAIASGLGVTAFTAIARLGMHIDLNHASAVATGGLATTAYLVPHYREMRRAQLVLRESEADY